jgi:hypothetical protein
VVEIRARSGPIMWVRRKLDSCLAGASGVAKHWCEGVPGAMTRWRLPVDSAIAVRDQQELMLTKGDSSVYIFQV